MKAPEGFVERIAQSIENKGNSKVVHDRLQELLQNARRGVDLQVRYAPKIGRKFLISR